jgi:hypothetical protein
VPRPERAASASPAVHRATPSSTMSLSTNCPGIAERAGNPPALGSQPGVVIRKVRVVRNMPAANPLPVADPVRPHRPERDEQPGVSREPASYRADGVDDTGLGQRPSCGWCAVCFHLGRRTTAGISRQGKDEHGNVTGIPSPGSDNRRGVLVATSISTASLRPLPVAKPSGSRFGLSDCHARKVTPGARTIIAMIAIFFRGFPLEIIVDHQ